MGVHRGRARAVAVDLEVIERIPSLSLVGREMRVYSTCLEVACQKKRPQSPGRGGVRGG
jgi:hypothetical protein